MRTPEQYTPESLEHFTARESYMDSHWRAVRPEGFHGLYLWRRLWLAIGVFVGRWDVLTWEDDPRAQWTYTPIEPSQAMVETTRAIEDEITKRVGIPSGHVEPGKPWPRK